MDLHIGIGRSAVIKKNIIGSILLKVCSVAISLLLVPLTLGYVSSEVYGIWLTLSSVVVWLGFFDAGFTQGLKNKLAEAIALGDYVKGKKLVSTTYGLMTLVFIPVLLLCEYIISFVDWAQVFNVNKLYNEDIVRTLYAVAGFVCLQMIVNVLVSVAAAYQKVSLSSLFPVIGNFLSLIVICVLTKLTSPSLLGLAFSLSFMPLLVTIIASLILYRTLFVKVSPSLHSIDWIYVKDIWGLGWRFFIIQVQGIVLFQATNLLLTNLSSPYAVTEYNIAYKYLGILEMLMSIILMPIWPAYTDAKVKNDYKWMRRIYKKTILLATILSIGIISLVCISPYAYELWIGDKAIIHLSMTLAIAVQLIFSFYNMSNAMLLNGLGCVKVQTVVALGGILLHIPLSLFLGSHFGTVGVVLSLIILRSVSCPVYFIQVRKILHGKAAGIWIK